MKDFLILNSVASRLNFLGFASTMRGSKSQGKAMSLPQASQTHPLRPQTLSQASSQVCPTLLERQSTWHSLFSDLLCPQLWEDPVPQGGDACQGKTHRPDWVHNKALLADHSWAGLFQMSTSTCIYSFLTPDHLSQTAFFF